MKAFLALLIKILPVLGQYLLEQQRQAQSQANTQNGYDHGELEAHDERKNLSAAKYNVDVGGVRDSDVYTSPIGAKSKSSRSDKTNSL